MATFKVILCLALLRTFTQVIAEDCLLRYESYCITVHLQKLSFHNAVEECRGIKGLLVIPTNKDKQNKILNELKNRNFNQQKFWIGLSYEWMMDNDNNGIWRYSDGTKLQGFTSWSLNEPNGKENEDCVELSINGGWNDINCSDVLPFICETLEKRSCCYKNISIPNAFFQHCNQSTLLPHGETFNFICHNGYTSKVRTVSCDDGVWKTDGECIPSCTPPLVPNNMRLLSDKTIYFLEEEADFICKNGFFLKENQPILKNSYKCVGRNGWSYDNLPCVSPEHFLMANPGDFRDSITIEFIDDDVIILNCSNEEQQNNSSNYSFMWSKDAKELQLILVSSVNYSISETGQLKLFNISEDVEGIYICIKQKINTNEIQQITTYKLRSVKDKCLIANQTTFVEFNESQYKILRCRNFKEHFTFFRWSKDNNEIGYDDDNYLVLQDGSLLLKGIKHDHAGKYTCKVTEISSSCSSYDIYIVTIKPTVNSICGKSLNINTGIHPWFVSLWWDDEEKPFCYGVLVSDQWIASAASCLANIRRRMYPHIYIQLGFNDNFTFQESDQLSVNTIIIHAMYSKRLMVNDIGLIKLSKPLPLNEETGILCLMSTEIANILIHQKPCEPQRSIIGNVFGMGPLESREHISKTDLMLVAQNDQCRHFVDFSFAKTMFCAEILNKTVLTVAGDIGSPFVIEINGRLYLYGIYIWGERISRVGKFDYFMKAHIFYEWIMSHIK